MLDYVKEIIKRAKPVVKPKSPEIFRALSVLFKFILFSVQYFLHCFHNEGGI